MNWMDIKWEHFSTNVLLADNKSKNLPAKLKKLPVKVRHDCNKLLLCWQIQKRKNYSTAMMVPNTSVTSMTFKWSTLGTTKTLLRASQSTTLRTWWPLWQSFIYSVWRWDSVSEWQPLLRPSTDLGFMAEWKLLLFAQHLEVCLKNKIIWPDDTKLVFHQFSSLCLKETRHHSSLLTTFPHPIPTTEAQWWQNHAVHVFFSSRDWDTGQDWGKSERCYKRDIFNKNLFHRS